MFERRLKIFLIIVFALISVLLARAAQLQVIGKSEWEQEAATLSRRKDLTETTRGRILDCRNNVIAEDQPCIDAWVEFGAISEDEDWLRDAAMRRLATTQPGVYRKAGSEQRKIILEGAIAGVKTDLDHLWETLARETGRPVDEIEETRQAIRQRVLMRERYIQYAKFERASSAKSPTSAPSATPATKPSWLQRVLTAGSSEEIEIDHFEFDSEEQKQAHAVARNIKPESYTRLAKDIDHLPGLVLKPGAVRRYPYGKAGAHVLGHLGVVTKNDLDSPSNPKNDDLREYQPTDLVGRGGLEQLFEPTLRGTRGYVQYPAGRKDEVVATEKAIAGKDVRTTIDIELQAQVQQLFEHVEIKSNLGADEKRSIKLPMHGAAVVIDIPTNEVRVLASYPDFDPNELPEHYADLVTDYLNLPLFNRATHDQFEPGSTVKPAVGLGGIADGVIKINEGIECTGYLIINGVKQQHGKCWTASFLNDPRVGPSGIAHHQIPIPHRGHDGYPDGSLSFADAIERSCNVYFETVADRLGPDRLGHWFDKFGLGHETGLGIAEARGQIPGPEAKIRPSLTWFSAIGQTTMCATPIQIGNMVATIARGGTWMKPKLVAPGQPNLNLAPVPLRDGRVLPDQMDLKLDPAAVQAAHDGMRRVVNGDAGTGGQAHMKEIVVAGKTGTAQAHPQYLMDEKGKPVKLPGKDGKLGTDDDLPVEMERATFDHETKTPWYRGWGNDGTKLNHSWFVCFAPAQKPQVAIVVLVEYGGAGGQAAGSIVRQVLTACAEHGYLKFSP